MTSEELNTIKIHQTSQSIIETFKKCSVFAVNVIIQWHLLEYKADCCIFAQDLVMVENLHLIHGRNKKLIWPIKKNLRLSVSLVLMFYRKIK